MPGKQSHCSIQVDNIPTAGREHERGEHLCVAVVYHHPNKLGVLRYDEPHQVCTFG